MPHKDIQFRASTWLVILAVVLQTLWPVVSTSNGVMEMFSHEAAAEHDHADADAAHDHESGDHHDGADKQSHCDFCTSAAVGAVMPLARLPAPDTPCKVDSLPQTFTHSQLRTLLVHTLANPRAPPVPS
jgi:hypothetical protein